ncbi:hypothetical protein LCGC14_0470050 [marine sediment metagenome]|uniref:Polysaccharide biosynthesis protein C-terminal domain-containing protein n=1 Tax=marine sediment metagenome TaxID=412755 RepID=A0A0F9SCJ6_9ZZZZ
MVAARNTPKKKLTKEHRILAKNSLYSFMYTYGNFFFSIISASLIARTISPEVWQYLILTISLVGFFNLIASFLPPSVGLSFIYYVSQFHALNQNAKLRSFTKNAIILRMGFLIPIFLLSIFVFTIFLEMFKINLKEYFYLFYLLSPLIIINGLQKMLINLIQALNMFKKTLILLIISNLIYIGGLLFVFLFVNSSEVGYIAIITVMSVGVPFIVSCFIVFLHFKLKIKKTEEKGESFKKCAKKIIKYGSYISINSGLSTFSIELKTQMVGLFEIQGMVTGYHIAKRYNSVSGATISPLAHPLTISFTRLYSKEQFNQIQRLYNAIFKYSLLFFLLGTGFLFFMTDFFLYIVYGETYLIYSLLVKLSLISIIFNIQDSFLGSFFLATNRVKHLAFITLIFLPLQLALFTIGLLFFGIIGSIVFSLISHIITLICYTIILFKFKIKLNIKKPIQIFSIFFISLLGASILESLVLKKFYLTILQNINLMSFQYFNPLSLGIFLLFFIILSIILRVVTISDIETLESLISKDSFSHKIIRKSLSISKKFLRS